MKTYLLVDANNLAARCHHSMNELSTRGGIKTGAMVGFLKGISWVRWKTQIPLRDTVIIWDGGHADYRLKLYPEYKQGRKLNEPKTPEDERDSAAYKAQLAFLREIMDTLEVKQLQVGGVEADDLISIFATLTGHGGGRSIIYSGDGDMHQLHSPTCSIFDPKKELMGWGDIKTKWKVQEPSDLLLYKALVGDPSDNIKGVKQIGPKRAQIVCCYLRAKLTRKGWRVEVKRTGWDEKDGKWVDKALAEQKLIQRNLKLMALPSSFAESYYTHDQAEEALTQWLTPSTRNTRKFIAHLERFELHSILDNLTNW